MRRPVLACVLLGLVLYILAMAVTIPASTVFKNRPWRTGIAGTVWNGQVGIAGASTASWQWAPLRSIANLGYAADFQVESNAGTMTGAMVAGFGGARFDNVHGMADAGLLQALLPALPFGCDMPMQVDFDHLALGGADRAIAGHILTQPGSCRPFNNATATAVPALRVTAAPEGDTTRIRIVRAEQRTHILVDAVLANDGALSLTVTEEGAAVLPFLGIPAGARIETRF